MNKFSTNFEPFNRFSLATYRLIQVDKRQYVGQSKTSKSHSNGAIGDFSRKNTANNNFLTVQPISTDNILIDSDRLAERDENLDSFL
jgi:hypothetical protein